MEHQIPDPAELMRAMAGGIILMGVVLAAPAVAEEPDGAALYQAECASCHGADGRGETPTGKVLGVKSLLDPRWASEDAVDAIAQAIREGVPKMPAKGEKLSQPEIEAVARVVRDKAAAAPK